MTETERTGREARTDSEAPTDKKDPDVDAGAVSIAPGDNRVFLSRRGTDNEIALDADDVEFVTRELQRWQFNRAREEVER